jgi:hypothetical protein
MTTKLIPFEEGEIWQDRNERGLQEGMEGHPALDGQSLVDGAATSLLQVTQGPLIAVMSGGEGREKGSRVAMSWDGGHQWRQVVDVKDVVSLQLFEKQEKRGSAIYGLGQRGKTNEMVLCQFQFGELLKGSREYAVPYTLHALPLSYALKHTPQGVLVHNGRVHRQLLLESVTNHTNHRASVTRVFGAPRSYLKSHNGMRTALQVQVDPTSLGAVDGVPMRMEGRFAVGMKVALGWLGGSVNGIVNDVFLEKQTLVIDLEEFFDSPNAPTVSHILSAFSAAKAHERVIYALQDEDAIWLAVRWAPLSENLTNHETWQLSNIASTHRKAEDVFINSAFKPSLKNQPIDDFVPSVTTSFLVPREDPEDKGALSALLKYDSPRWADLALNLFIGQYNWTQDMPLKLKGDDPLFLSKRFTRASHFAPVVYPVWIYPPAFLTLSSFGDVSSTLQFDPVLDAYWMLASVPSRSSQPSLSKHKADTIDSLSLLALQFSKDLVEWTTLGYFPFDYPLTSHPTLSLQNDDLVLTFSAPSSLTNAQRFALYRIPQFRDILDQNWIDFVWPNWPEA